MQISLQRITAVSATLLLGLDLCGGFAPSARAAFVVSPGAATSTEGDANNSFPFNITPVGVRSQRYQQVYNSSDFAALGGPALITRISFRPDNTGAAFSSALNVQIHLSTTGAAADGLSGTFADNVGGDDTVVFSGALNLSSAFTGPTAGPKNFDILINLTTGFRYDPGAGNLLLDVRNFTGGSTTPFDSVKSTSDAVFRVWSRDVNSATAFVGDSIPTSGLVTGFTTSPVPEPGGFALLGFGTLLLTAHRHRKA